MPEAETIQVLGRGTNVEFLIDDSAPFEMAERQLREYLVECRDLYSSGTITVNVGRRILVPEQLSAIKGIMGQETGLTITRYWCPPETLSRALAGPEYRLALPSPELDGQQSGDNGALDSGELAQSTGLVVEVVGRVAGADSLESASEDADQDQEPDVAETDEMAPAAVPEDSSPAGTGETGSDSVHFPFQNVLSRGSEALMVKNTCRSGEVVRYPGDVVVFGDVNPGAEIVAGGDIMVLGALRGMAHAGADGDIKATIFALNLEAHRLQIGSHVGERPRGMKKGKGGGRPVNPQIAYLRRRSIYVAPFERRCEEYQGGVPYEG